MNKHPNSARAASGFALFEMVLAVALFGLISLFIADMADSLKSAIERGYKERQSADNLRLVSLFREYTAQQEAFGLMENPSLPAPWWSPATKNNSAFVDPSGADGFSQFLASRGITPEMANTDGKSNPRVRVYQKAQGLKSIEHIRGGTKVEVAYDMGVLYLSDCKKNETCNTNLSTGDIPGGNPFTNATRTTWKPAVTDVGLVMFSNYDVQKGRLKRTEETLETVLKSIRTFSEVTGEFPRIDPPPANPGDSHPVSELCGEPPPARDLHGEVFDPLSNAGCATTWVIGTCMNNWLQKMGLNPDRYGTTDWGTKIYYCRDYRPNPGTPSGMFAALATWREISKGEDLLLGSVNRSPDEFVVHAVASQR